MNVLEEACRAIVRMDLERYIRILEAELDHLERRVELMVASYLEKEERHEVTEHVCHENVAVLENEECGLRRFITILHRLDLDAYPDLDALVAAIKAQFKAVIEHSGLAAATYVFAERKVNKVYRYVTERT